MADKLPLLVFPQPLPAERQGLRSNPGTSRRPLRDRQFSRLSPQFAQLEQFFGRRQAELVQTALGVVPEQVLVMETVGTIDEFMKAVRRINGMEWLAEWDSDDVAPDSDYYSLDEQPTKRVQGQLLLVMSNQQALQELLSLWQHYHNDPTGTWAYGRTKWRDLFDQLHTIRPWDAQDRLANTGLEEWIGRLSDGQDWVRLEIELWYRSSAADQDRSAEEVAEIVRDTGGRIISQTRLPEIAYHAVLAEVPIEAVNLMLRLKNTRLVRCERVMFFRPVGQSSVGVPGDDPINDSGATGGQPGPSGDAVVALLDGLPLENHQRLAGRLMIDDPDGWAAFYRPGERNHGTAMASLIVHGELDANEDPLRRPVYVRPIMHPDASARSFFKETESERILEQMPPDILPVDLIHRAVRRICEGERGMPAIAPAVRVINLSVGDPARPFDRIPSAWARLLDWLAHRYGILFIVSAGNANGNLVLDFPHRDLATVTATQLEQSALRAIANDAPHRLIISPAEAVNALTIGALHADFSTTTIMGLRKDLFGSSAYLPSPINRVGPGFRRSIKPDLLISGGRQLYLEELGSHAQATLKISDVTTHAPGQAVAAPGVLPGDLTAKRYLRGTSNAAALTTRRAAQLYEILQYTRQEIGGALLEDRFTSVILKALLVHGARWGSAAANITSARASALTSAQRKEWIARSLGYGMANPERVFSCTDQRATLLGCGELGNGQAHLYSIPLPPGLSSWGVRRCLTITLAWLAPINPYHQRYHQAGLWFEPPGTNNNTLRIQRQDADWHAVQRGTVQHEVLEGVDVVTYADGGAIEIKINCRSFSRKETPVAVPYGMAVTLEVDEGIPIQIYDEIRTRIRPAVRVVAPHP